LISRGYELEEKAIRLELKLRASENKIDPIADEYF